MQHKKLSLITISLAIALSNISGCSKELTLEEYLVEAKTQIDEGNQTAAILSLKNAIRIQPENPKIRFDLGNLYLLQRDLLSAEKELEKAQSLGFEDPLLLPNITKVKMLLGKFDETYKLADNSGAYESEQYVIILTYAGLAAISDNKKGIAQDYINQALMLSEDSLYSQLGKAWLGFSNDRFTEVENTLSQILEESEGFSEAILLSGHLFQAQFQYDKAVEMYTRYIKLHPRHFQVQLYLVNSLLSAKKLKEAEKQLVFLNKIYGNHPLVNLYNAQIAYQSNRFAEARVFAEKSLSTSNGSINMAQLIAGLSAYKLGELESAYSYLSKVESFLAKNHEVKKLIALLQLQLGFESDAQLAFENMDVGDVNDISILNYASKTFAEKGKNEVAEHLLGKIAKAKPDDINSSLKYTAKQLANGDKEQLKVLEKLAKDPNESNQAPMVLATHYINEKDYDNAFRVAQEWQNTKVGQLKGKLLEGFIHVQKGDLTSAKSVFKALLTQDKTNVVANYYLSEFAFNEGKFEESLTYIETILAFEPLHKTSVARMSRINERLGKPNDTIDYLNKLLLKYPDNQEVKTDLAITLNKSGAKKDAIKLLEDVKGSDRVGKLQRTLARFYVENNELNKAKSIYRTMVESNAIEADVWLEYAIVDRRLGNVETALLTVEKALKTASSNQKLLLLKANLLIELKRTESAADLIKDLTEQYPESEDVAYLSAQLHVIKNNLTEAQKQFERLYKANPENKFLLKLARVYAANDNKLAAITLFEKHEKSSQLSSASQAFFAELLLDTNASKAKTIYINLLKKYPDNVIILNNLSLAYSNAEEFDNALLYAKKAYSHTKSSTTLDTYANALIAKNKVNEAIKHITDSDNEALVNEKLTLTLIESYLTLGKMSKAKQLFNTFSQISDDQRARFNKINNQLN